MIVNIYVYQSIRGPGTKKGAFTYILETEKDGKLVTLTQSGILEPMTEKRAEILVVIKALERLRKECEVHVIGVSIPVKTAFESWIDKWIKNDWKNARGQEVANMTEWQQICEFRNKYAITMTEFQDHSYKNWMIRETEKKAKECE